MYAPDASIEAKARQREEKIPFYKKRKCGIRASLYWPAPRARVRLKIGPLLKSNGRHSFQSEKGEIKRNEVKKLIFVRFSRMGLTNAESYVKINV